MTPGKVGCVGCLVLGGLCPILLYVLICPEALVVLLFALVMFLGATRWLGQRR